MKVLLFMAEGFGYNLTNAGVLPEFGLPESNGSCRGSSSNKSNSSNNTAV